MFIIKFRQSVFLCFWSVLSAVSRGVQFHSNKFSYIFSHTPTQCVDITIHLPCYLARVSLVISVTMSEPSVVPSWSGGLGRSGGFYQDAEWYNQNIARFIIIISLTIMFWDIVSRRMPLVPKMIQELVFALPPLGEARVLDLLCRKSER